MKILATIQRFPGSGIAQPGRDCRKIIEAVSPATIFDVRRKTRGRNTLFLLTDRRRGHGGIWLIPEFFGSLAKVREALAEFSHLPRQRELANSMRAGIQL